MTPQNSFMPQDGQRRHLPSHWSHLGQAIYGRKGHQNDTPFPSNLSHDRSEPTYRRPEWRKAIEHREISREMDDRVLAEARRVMKALQHTPLRSQTVRLYDTAPESSHQRRVRQRFQEDALRPNRKEIQDISTKPSSHSTEREARAALRSAQIDQLTGGPPKARHERYEHKIHEMLAREKATHEQRLLLRQEEEENTDDLEQPFQRHEEEEDSDDLDDTQLQQQQEKENKQRRRPRTVRYEEEEDDDELESSPQRKELRERAALPACSLEMQL